MSEPRPSASGAPVDLQEVAQRLREADHLEPAVQQELADLMDQLAAALADGTMSPEERQHLAESAAHLAHALHQRHDSGMMEAARDRLSAAALNAEIKAPVATGVVRQMIDTLANLGI